MDSNYCDASMTETWIETSALQRHVVNSGKMLCQHAAPQELASEMIDASAAEKVWWNRFRESKSEMKQRPSTLTATCGIHTVSKEASKTSAHSSAGSITAKTCLAKMASG